MARPVCGSFSNATVVCQGVPCQTSNRKPQYRSQPSARPSSAMLLARPSVERVKQSSTPFARLCVLQRVLPMPPTSTSFRVLAGPLFPTYRAYRATAQALPSSTMTSEESMRGSAVCAVRSGYGGNIDRAISPLSGLNTFEDESRILQQPQGCIAAVGRDMVREQVGDRLHVQAIRPGTPQSV